MCTRSVLRLLLGFIIGKKPWQVKIRTKKSGKLYVEGLNKIQFSLSHSDRLATIAISKASIKHLGVDIQKIKKSVNINSIAKRFFSKQEFNELRLTKQKAQKVQLFFKLWTQKEAIAKALGMNLSKALETKVPSSKVFSIQPSGRSSGYFISVFAK